MRRVLSVLLFAISLPVFGDITVATVTPSSGLIAGGTIVHVHGTNLLGAPLACASVQCSVYVQFGDTLGKILFDSVDEIVVVAPPHAAGPVDLVVNVPVSTPLTLKNAFIYQDPGDTTVRVLLPIATGSGGLFNTSWKTDILAHNETTTSIDVAGTTIPPMATRPLTLLPPSTGMFLEIPRRVFDSVTITTHVHDTTHDAESLGVDIPSIPETQFRPGVVLNGIPNDPRYRVLLRVYGYPGGAGYPLVVRIRDDQNGQLLDQQVYDVSRTDPAYLQLPVSAAPTSSVLRVEVTGADRFASAIWAFITLTNDVTQSVTTITPHVAIAPEAPSTGLGGGHWSHAGNCMSVSGSFAVVSYGGCTVGSFNLAYANPDGHFEVDGPSLGSLCCNTAHFSGLLINNVMVLTIRTATQTIGPFTLIHGSTEPCAPSCP